ncbi:transforming growth factor beta-1-induced transcript 1 protein isoform X2 [Nilaparvata lugens]|uniref:transforming growth factor beta-1-induced transcript 1 protein isoform X2 n=2 Tax=Nilaparvata lugens TaxID=108931 RepID=UPI00193E16E4|nr:transforming growth factor beta-1-induced transcript 1 protein isoform X2 [Nilaparvata lugens]
MELIEQFVLTVLMIYIGYKKAITFTRKIQQRAAVLEQQQKIADCLKKAEKESFLGTFSPPPRLSVDIAWPEDIDENEARILKRTSLKRESICEDVIVESCDERLDEECAKRKNETIVEDDRAAVIEEVCDEEDEVFEGESREESKEDSRGQSKTGIIEGATIDVEYSVGENNSLEVQATNNGNYSRNKQEKRQEAAAIDKNEVRETSEIDPTSNSTSCFEYHQIDQETLTGSNIDSSSQTKSEISFENHSSPKVDLKKQENDTIKPQGKFKPEEPHVNKDGDVCHSSVKLIVDREVAKLPTKKMEEDIEQPSLHQKVMVVDALNHEDMNDQKSGEQNQVSDEEDKESETASLGSDDTAATIGDDEFYSLCLPPDDDSQVSSEFLRGASPSSQKTSEKPSLVEKSRNTQGSSAPNSSKSSKLNKDNTVYLCSAKVRQEGLDPECQLKNNEVVIGNCEKTKQNVVQSCHKVTSQQGASSSRNGSDEEEDSVFHNAISVVDENSRLIFSGEYTKAMNKDWHSGHFCCWQCDESLTGQRYVLRDDHPYCIKCYESVFANPCEQCNKTIGIDSKDLSYKDKHWHEACFLCNKCQVSLVDKQFGSKGEKIYCGNCYDTQFASRCDGCTQIFRAGTKKMEYKTRQWHEQCFCCCVCKSPIGTKSFIPREQEIYCATCYEEKFATRCVKCNKIITSGGVTYKNEPWHRECFTCTNCSLSLAGQRFTSRDEKPYCADCFGELFAKRCTSCCKPITGIGGTRFISFEDRHWHNDCFICAMCKNSLVGRGFITDGDDIICPDCAKTKLM